MLSTSPVNSSRIPRIDCLLAALLFLAALILRVCYAYNFRIDSDEPQHLHVVWAWTQGLLPYRDVFDNHSPLFQALSAPLFQLLGVRPDIVLPMRVAMIPLFAGVIWCVWKISATLFARRTALWTAVYAAFCPPFFLTSVEFRPDELWTLAWLLTLTTLITGRATPRRAFAAGLLLGIAFSVSMKSSLLVATLAFAMIGTVLLRRRPGMAAIDWPRLLRCAGTGLLGMAVVPAVVVLFFVTKGADGQLYHCVIQHNLLPDQNRARHFLKSSLRWLAWALPIAAGGFFLMRRSQPLPTRSRITFVFLAATFYLTTMTSFWPIITAETRLPAFPVLMVAAGPALLWLMDRATAALRLPSFILPALLVGAELAVILHTASPLKDETADKIGIVADTLKLTQQSDFVMDSKGETIYRQRPFFYVLEGLTFRRLGDGSITDDIPERLIKTGAPLATLLRMPERAKTFIRANYVPIAFRLSVLGKVIRTRSAPPGFPCSFDVVIPARYTIVSASGALAGTLDGQPFTTPRVLVAGRHEFLPASDAKAIMLVWAQAIERGYSPFHSIRKDYRTPQD